MTRLPSFSTLCGSKEIGTDNETFQPGGDEKFQYPLRVEIDWNYAAPNLIINSGSFQYPLRVEIDWNSQEDRPRQFDIRFQYPLRVEIDWNSIICGGPAQSMLCFSTLCGSK